MSANTPNRADSAHTIPLKNNDGWTADDFFTVPADATPYCLMAGVEARLRQARAIIVAATDNEGINSEPKLEGSLSAAVDFIVESEILLQHLAVAHKTEVKSAYREGERDLRDIQLQIIKQQVSKMQNRSQEAAS